MYRYITILVFVFYLSGCSDATPMRMTGRYIDYVGVWQLRMEEITKSTIKIDNMLLAINHDSSAVYRKCKVNKSKSRNTDSGTSYSVNFHDAVVTQIIDHKITLVQKLGWFGFSNTLKIDRKPYQKDEVWFIEVEGKKLVKLSGQEIATETNWVCPGNDDDDKQENRKDIAF